MGNGRNFCINNCQLRKLKLFTQRTYNLSYRETILHFAESLSFNDKMNSKAAIY